MLWYAPSTATLLLGVSCASAVLGAWAVLRACSRYPTVRQVLLGESSVPAVIPKGNEEERALAKPTGQIPASHDMGLGLTALLAKMFPFMAAAVESMVSEMVPPLLDKYKPKWMEGINIVKFSLGSEPPVVQQMAVDSHKSSASEDEIRIVMSLRWESDCDVQLDIKPLPTNLKFVPGFVEKGLKSALTIQPGISRLKFDATVLVTLAPLYKRLPVAGAMQVCLLDPPVMDFTMSLSRDSEQSTLLNLVKPWLIETIRASFSFLTLPEHLHIPIEMGAADVYRPHGILKVCIESAGKVPAMDLLSKSDPYCKFWVRPRVVHKTAVVRNTHYPEWRHEAYLLVHDKKYQFLMSEVWDDDSDDVLTKSADDFVGSAFVRLRDVPDDGSPLQVSLPLCSEHIDTTSEQSKAPKVPGAAAEGGVCRLNMTLQWIPSAQARAVPALRTPGCIQVYVKTLSVRDDWAAKVFPIGLVTNVLGHSYESPLRWKVPQEPVHDAAPAALAPAAATVTTTSSSAAVSAPLPALQPGDGNSAPLEPAGGAAAKGKSGEGAEQVPDATRKWVQLALPYVASFDIVGVADDVLRQAPVEVKVRGGSPFDDVSRFEVPMQQVLDMPVPGLGNVSGGTFTVTDRLQLMTATLDIWWHGLM